ncbi:MAG: energy-dependent translational throttle protein EttA [Burkholderiales bacterium]|uniref:Energy-dependent translational throttle protein EttA n=2 Tax=Janthinobacterium TaxID=29580 RepID=A0A1S1U1Z8_9BURK|nr:MULTISPECIES: energy-dependent translational throttle protein EttA [Janthinobacterium]MBH1982683.1 energy-dependent translational throttle protein EttA [Burkholderiales bacterium]MBH1993593.1 energy-dependent translational throttle protein EttA [Burkholderiales bacterium]MBH2068506.1 energy-dependent translational throttle protein EttA [Burkholderiales bacterium]OHV94246.1 ABC transporter ATP-binding protein [Janthinobacterium lividum]QDG72274.1 energy-dependent translational throttle prote
MANYVYTMNRVGKIVPPKRQILKDISLSFFPGAKIGVLGLNGSGKSTLLKIMAGIDTDIQGEAVPMPGLNIGYLPQEPQLDPEKTVRQEVESGLGEVFEAQAKLEAVYAAYAEEDADFDALATEQARLEAIISTSDGGNLNLQLEMAADALRLPPWDASIGVLSGGEKRRVALCKLLLSKPDMLLLDEPTNHLDAESVDWLEQFLLRFPGTVVAITHDRYFLDNAAEWILELDRGSGIPWKGNYSTWLEQKQARLKQEESTESARQKALQKELEWSRQNPKARQAKSKARLARFNELSEHEYQKRNETQEIFIPVAERLGNDVIEFKNVSKAFGDRLLIDNLSFTVPPGAIVGIIGPNGAGKSTLFKMITGKEQPDSGEVAIGQTARVSIVDQNRGDSLSDSKTVFQDVCGGADMLTVGRFEMPSRAYLGRFNFKGGDQQKIVGNLSGGERGRLHLAKTLLMGGNVLLLDEPSNDLDVETLRALEDALLEFAGSVMVISHDRWFLDRIATHILAFEGDSQVTFFDGNYQEYEADKKKRLGDEGAKPKRIRYKPLTV